jgi:hypothetical protein
MSQMSPPGHVAPLASVVHPTVETPGWHDWHELPGLMVPETKYVPPMKHPALQFPEVHTSPLGQLEFGPSVLVQLDEPPLPPGWQLRQGLAASWALGATNAPAM